MKKSFEERYKEIKNLYLKDQSPWIVAYSGGKDSSTTLSIIYESLIKMKREGHTLNKPVYVIYSDTLVENPVIINYIDNNLNAINEDAKKRNLPVIAKKVKPILEETFWTLLIGKGYVPPKNTTRWCTDRLKIRPSNRFIKEKLKENQKAIVILGVRSEESTQRKKSIEDKSQDDSILLDHDMKNVDAYAPIRDFDLEDVWNYLLKDNSMSPWGSDNTILHQLYKDSNAKDAPMALDSLDGQNSQSAGKSRFGCWVCTLVREDKSLTGVINSGKTWLQPMLDFRDWLYSIRHDHELRDKFVRTRNKEIVYKLETKDGVKLGPGGLNLKARKKILKKLLKTQKKVREYLDKPLISKEELLKIRDLWIQKGDIEDSMPKIYEEVYNEKFEEGNIDIEYLYNEEERATLEEYCEENDIPLQLAQRLLTTEAEHKYIEEDIKEEEIMALFNHDWPYIDDIDTLLTLQGAR